MVCSCDSDCGQQFEMDIYDSENAMLLLFENSDVTVLQAQQVILCGLMRLSIIIINWEISCC